MNNVACSRLGTMLHLDIQMGGEAVKTSNFRKYIRVVQVSHQAIKCQECFQRLLFGVDFRPTLFFELIYSGVLVSILALLNVDL